MSTEQESSLQLELYGHVQGVGMRPYLFCLAQELGLKGIIFNNSSGVGIKLDGPTETLHIFLKRALCEISPPAQITKHQHLFGPSNGYQDLQILKSSPQSSSAATKITQFSLPPDQATCTNCWQDFNNPQSRYYQYPFISCAQCGPRWTIIKKLPFERCHTTYSDFPMCQDCLQDYNNPTNRRFHAQTLSCAACGPKLKLHLPQGIIDNDVFAKLCSLLKNGAVGLVKGLGGFQLIGDATNIQVIERIRNLKSRPEQALAIMIKDETSFLHLGGTPEHWKKLSSPIAAIQSLPRLKLKTAKELAPDLVEIGVMAPTTALHKLIFKELTAMIVTSGNPQGQGIAKDFEEINFNLGQDIDFILDHNRQITHAIDDSVARENLILRKARGLTPHRVDTSSSQHIYLGLGADLKNSLSIKYGNFLFEAPYAGDLSDVAIANKQKEALINLMSLLELTPEKINFTGCDIHPQSETARLFTFSEQMEKVPHHLAHAYSVADNAPQIILTFDGTGFNEDMHLGGGDAYFFDGRQMKLLTSLKPISWVGGDGNVRTPWKSLVMFALSQQVPLEKLAQMLPDVSKEDLFVFYQLCSKAVGTPCTSMGRWFDAAAALIEFGARTQSYEAQAPIRLEHLAKTFAHGISYEFNPEEAVDGGLILEILADLKMSGEYIQSDLAYLAHDLMAQAWAESLSVFSCQHVSATGGVFQNLLFSERLQYWLEKKGKNLFIPEAFPVNDQCIARGQIAYMESHYARS